MSYMTADQVDELGDFMAELNTAFENYAPSALDFKVEISISKWSDPIGKLTHNADGIVFEPASPKFQNYVAPDKKVAE